MKKLILFYSLLFCAATKAAIVFNYDVVISNQCTKPISFYVYEPHNQASATCQLGGTVENPDSWDYLCEFVQVSVLATALYDEHSYHFDNSYTAKTGAACYFYGCDDDPLQVNIKCVSNSAGQEFDTENDSVSATPTP